MAYFNEFPNTRTYDSDLGWIISRMKQLIYEMDNFTSFNTIKFADNPVWNIETAYEANTLVLYRKTVDGVTNEITYVSKKPVPQGVNITNTDYWMQISDYNAGLQELRDAITEVHDETTAAQQSADEAQQSADNAQQSANDALEIAAPGSWHNSDVIIIGDSYASGTGSNDGNGWPYYFKNMTGCNEVGYAYQSGGGFAAVGNENATYPGLKYHECITEIANGMSESARDNVKLIILQSGWNDASNNRNPDGPAAVVTGLEQALTKCQNLFVNASVYVIPTWSTAKINAGPSSAAIVWNTIVNTLGDAQYFGKCMASPDSYVWFYDEGASFGAGDGIHYNATGYRRMANYIYAVTKGWGGRKCTASRGVTNVDGVTGTLYCTVQGNEVNIHGSVKMEQLNSNAWNEIGTLPKGCTPVATKYMMGVVGYGASGHRAPLCLRLAADSGIGVNDLNAFGGTAQTNITIYVDINYKVQTP